jgi:hypothetical protein
VTARGEVQRGGAASAEERAALVAFMKARTDA